MRPVLSEAHCGYAKFQKEQHEYGKTHGEIIQPSAFGQVISRRCGKPDGIDEMSFCRPAMRSE